MLETAMKIENWVAEIAGGLSRMLITTSLIPDRKCRPIQPKTKAISTLGSLQLSDAQIIQPIRPAKSRRSIHSERCAPTLPTA